MLISVRPHGPVSPRRTMPGWRKAPQLRGLRPGHLGLLCGQSREGTSVLARPKVPKRGNRRELFAAEEGGDVEVAGARLELRRALARDRRRLEARPRPAPPL